MVCKYAVTVCFTMLDIIYLSDLGESPKNLEIAGFSTELRATDS